MRIVSKNDLDRLREAGRRKLYPDQTRISVGMASCGLAAGAGKVFEVLAKRIARGGEDVVLSPTGCLGFCRMEPLVTVYRPGRAKVVYANVAPARAEEFLSSILNGTESRERVLCHMAEEELVVENATHKLSRNGDQAATSVPSYGQVPFFARQMKVVLRNCGFLDPDDIEEYFGRSGYAALMQVLTGMSPSAVIDEVRKSGLRGRGGGGFPTAQKWEACRQSSGARKYVICNADEGDPGAYMDRSVLEGDPHSVLEGMLIGAYAIGAQEGIIYVRTEYPLAIEKLKTAIQQARDYGLLGADLLGTGFGFDVRIVEGSGAFVCGEETSLIASIEGQAPEPQPRPPFPVQRGLWGCPTNINNVETWANVPVILARGGSWYAGIGTEKSKGTKVFSLVGAIKNTGLVEVPMGTTLRQIVYDIGAGLPDDRQLKAIQTGGPSGGCIPARLVDLPVDYERLTEIGSIMGSGGMVVMDEDNCMVDIARYFTSFTREESCGKCTSCRDGLDTAHAILTRITEGRAEPDDLQLLQDLSQTIKDASECGLGKTAPNPILSTLRYFLAEYEEHLQEKKCAAGVCRALFAYAIDPARCKACGKCRAGCPTGAIAGDKGVPHRILAERCTKCGACYDVCPFEAVTKA